VKENANKLANKAKTKKAENVELNNIDKSTENTKKSNNNEKDNYKKTDTNQSNNPMDFSRKLKAVKDYLKNKAKENNEK